MRRSGGDSCSATRILDAPESGLGVEGRPGTPRCSDPTKAPTSAAVPMEQWLSQQRSRPQKHARDSAKTPASRICAGPCPQQRFVEATRKEHSTRTSTPTQPTAYRRTRRRAAGVSARAQHTARDSGRAASSHVDGERTSRRRAERIRRGRSALNSTTRPRAAAEMGRWWRAVGCSETAATALSPRAAAAPSGVATHGPGHETLSPSGARP